MLGSPVKLPLRQAVEPIGAVLAGGAGRRIGGDKACVRLEGRPLITFALESLRCVLRDVVVVAKADTVLPDVGEAAVWVEPAAPRHPLVGLRHALATAGGRPVVVCAADLPFVSPQLIRRLWRAASGRAPAAVASRRGRIQPLLGCYRFEAAEMLARAPEPAGPLRETVAWVVPARVEVSDERAMFNVNGPEDLLQAALMLRDPALGLNRR